MSSSSTIGSLATATGPHLWWIASRAAGIVALICSSASVGAGLMMASRVRGVRGPELRVAHEALSLATLAAIAVHGLTLIGDDYLKLSLADVSLPFASSYESFWTTTGIVAFWSLALLGLSYYARARIGVQRWRLLHRFTALAWILGVAHSVGEGTDAGQSWFLALTAVAVLPPLALLAYRWIASGRRSAPMARAIPTTEGR